MLVHIEEIVKIAEKGGYAIGAFNVTNLESVLGVARAAVKAKSPAIIQVSEGAIKYMGLKPITHIVSTVAKNIATNVPIALHLDHGKSFDSVFECINAGFSSVHIDASNLPVDENISLTKQVVNVAHAKGVWVQGEIGAMIGGHSKPNESKKLKRIPIAKLIDVVKFVRETKVDTIAAAVGTAHGIYKNEYIDFGLLRDIKKATRKVFVLHGGSGVADGMIKKGIKEGINIINIGSDIKIAFCRSLVKACLNNKKETDPKNLLKPTIYAVEKVVLAKMKLFGSFGQISLEEVET